MRTLDFKKLNQRGVHHYIIPAVAFVLLFAIIGAFLIVRPHAAPTYYLERMNVGGLCLDRSSTSANTLSWKCSDTDANQAWNLIPVGGNYMLQNKNSGQCVNDPGASVGSGPGHWTGLTSHSCDSSTGVVFRNYGGAWLNPASHYGGTNGCINDPGSSTAEGHQLIMYPCNGTGLTTFSSAVWGSTSGGGSGGGSKGSQMLARAKQFGGVPYVYGGGHRSYSDYTASCGVIPAHTTACGVDCSGLIQQVEDKVLSSNSITMTVNPDGTLNASNGSHWVSISKSNVQPGDIVTAADATGHVEFVDYGSGNNITTWGAHHSGTNVGTGSDGGFYTRAYRYE